MPKKHDFSKPPRWANKSQKSVRRATGSVIAVNGRVLLLARVPGAATRTTRKEERRKEESGQVGKGKSGKVGNGESLKGSNTPFGQRPGEFPQTRNLINNNSYR